MIPWLSLWLLVVKGSWTSQTIFLLYLTLIHKFERKVICLSLQRDGDWGLEIKVRKLVRQVLSQLSWVSRLRWGIGVLLCTAPGMVWLPKGSLQGKQQLLGSPSGLASITPEPTYLPGTHCLLLNVLFSLLFHLPLLSRRQLQEHMEGVWQLLDTDARLCNALFPPLLLLLSVSLAARMSSFLPLGGVCSELLVRCETLGEWCCWAGRMVRSLRLSLPFSHSSVSF